MTPVGTNHDGNRIGKIILTCTAAVFIVGFIAINGGFVKIEMTYNSPLLTKGRALLKERQYGDSLACLNKLIAQEPNNAAAYCSRADVYRNIGQLQKGIDDYNTAIKLDSKAVEAYRDRSLIYEQLGQYQKEIDDCSAAITLDPKDARAYNNRGWAYGTLEQYQKEIDDCSAAITLDP